MLNLFLMAGVLLAACVIAVVLMKRLMHSAQRLNVLHEEMARNDDLLREQVQRLAAGQDAPLESAGASENHKEK